MQIDTDPKISAKRSKTSELRSEKDIRMADPSEM
jgi:hypothetical protein